MVVVRSVGEFGRFVVIGRCLVEGGFERTVPTVGRVATVGSSLVIRSARFGLSRMTV